MPCSSTTTSGERDACPDAPNTHTRAALPPFAVAYFGKLGSRARGQPAREGSAAKSVAPDA
eukprot:4099995-Prymnesium_polylepis.2